MFKGLEELVKIIRERKNSSPDRSYTNKLLNDKKLSAEKVREEIKELLVTSMDRDGTQKGYDIDLMKKISEMVNIPVIASGGVGNLDHLAEGITQGRANAVLAASIFHYGKYSIKEAKQYLDSKGIPVRI